MFTCGLCEEKHEQQAATCVCHFRAFCQACVEYVFETDPDLICPMDGWTNEPLDHAAFVTITMPLGTMPFIPGPPYIH